VSHVEQVARWATAVERTIDMTDLRKCVGSVRFEIEAHDAPEADFPVQPSQKDGLGRMCKVHWNQYTAALRKAAASATSEPGAEPEPIKTKPSRAKAGTATPLEERVDAGTA
jgi:hypothetical protein